MTRDSHTLLLKAISKGDLKEVQKLVEVHNAPITNICFQFSVLYSQLDILTYFLENCHSPSCWPYALWQAEMEGKLHYIIYIIEYIKNHPDYFSHQNIRSYIDAYVEIAIM